jgi:hypothetical protein
MMAGFAAFRQTASHCRIVKLTGKKRCWSLGYRMSEQPQASAITTSEISNCLMIFGDEENVFFMWKTIFLTN